MGGLQTLKTQTIEKLLIANRGEIAIRIAQSCHALGISTVAVCSEADQDALHSHYCDESICIGPPAAAESYLKIDALIQAALDTNANAIHPGYGFLSENADFAEAVEKAGLIWVGPPAKAISVMGSKTAARTAAIGADVPVVPGEVDTAKAESVGFPLLIKAVGGGGGRGMRVVREAKELQQAIEAASREALSAFGNGDVFVERYIEQGRHIEIQVFGDQHGNVHHLYERECSVQRRHQKVVEEAPSVALDEDLRQKMGEAAIRVAKAVDYVGAGTVEFLLDQDGSFYFLEMNTRLQVEHPVTECITGLDLVALQLDVAQGEAFTDVPERAGASIEVRLYAEDPAEDYAPQTGLIHEFSFDEAEGIRVDTGVASGSEVSIHYDPMIAKIIASGENREIARKRLVRCLNRLCVLGLKTNQHQLIEILSHPDFIQGDIHTRWLEGQEQSAPSISNTTVIAALCGQLKDTRETLPAIAKGWRNSRFRSQLFTAGEIDIHWHPKGNGWSVRTGEQTQDLHFEATDNAIVLWLDGRKTEAVLAEDTSHHYVWTGGASVALKKGQRFPDVDLEDDPGACIASTPGKVAKLAVSEGQQVQSGDLLVVLEAMKMEQPLCASIDGVVQSVFVAEGEQVEAGQRLVELGPSE